MKLISAMGSAAALLASVAHAADAPLVPEIVIDGNKFFYSNNGSQFFMKGVAYQQQLTNASSGATFSDPLTDFAACQRDLPYLLNLETNVIRVYAINTSLSHDDCMNLFAQNGIYVIADMSEPGVSIIRDSPSWTLDLYHRYATVVDVMQGYSNMLGFFAGNEVTNNNTNTGASPFVKAAIRDTKGYMASMKYRAIPVGYSTNDDADTRGFLADYFTCGSQAESADFYGINMYEWCGNTVDFQTSGYADRTAEFANLTVPVFFSEYGCNVIQPRVFADVPSLYSTNMTSVWSGGIVYMYFEEQNNYGLVTIGANNLVTPLPDYTFLSNQLAMATPVGVSSANFKPTNTVSRACPASTLLDWRGSSDLPPTPNEAVCQCMYDSLSCVVASNVAEANYQTLFDYVCSQVSCMGITANGTSGQYGAYSFCSNAEKLSFVLNLYYKKVGSKDACGFSGSATLAGAASTASTCAPVLSQAGAVGTGLVTASISASFTGAIDGVGSSSHSSGGKASKPSSTGSSGSSGAKSAAASGSASGSAAKNGASGLSSPLGGAHEGSLRGLVSGAVMGAVVIGLVLVV